MQPHAHKCITLIEWKTTFDCFVSFRFVPERTEFFLGIRNRYINRQIERCKTQEKKKRNAVKSNREYFKNKNEKKKTKEKNLHICWISQLNFSVCARANTHAHIQKQCVRIPVRARTFEEMWKGIIIVGCFAFCPWTTLFEKESECRPISTASPTRVLMTEYKNVAY